MSKLPTLLVSIVLSLPPAAARADIVIGNYGDGETPQPLRVFADDANGDVAPARYLGGPLAGLKSPVAGVFEPLEGVLYVADFWGQQVQVLPAWANGDVAPIRVLDSPRVGQTRNIAVDILHDELITTNSGCCVAEYARTAEGDTLPLRWLQWGGSPDSVTQLNYPASLVYLTLRDEVAVADSDTVDPWAPKILVFRRTDEGNAAPLRVIKGANTGLGNRVGGLAWDAASQLLFATTYVQNADLSHSGRIVVFDADADGNSAPVRTIEGPSTGLETGTSAVPIGLAIDPVDHRLIVAVHDEQQQTGNRLLVFDLDDQGDAAPLQVIAGALTEMDSIGSPIWVPRDVVMRNGFD